MSFSAWIIFAAVAIATVLIPGPAVFLAITNGVTFGWRRVTFSSLGNILGLLVVSSLTMAGLGVLLKASVTVFTALKLAGAGYLIYLGFRQWRTRASAFARAKAVPSGVQRSNGRIFLQGLLIALTNPKAILFFTALFPQFIRSDQALGPQFLILMATFMSFSFLALMSYGFVAHAARTWFADQRRATWFNRCSGTVYLLLGVGMLRLKAARG